MGVDPFFFLLLHPNEVSKALSSTVGADAPPSPVSFKRRVQERDYQPRRPFKCPPGGSRGLTSKIRLQRLTWKRHTIRSAHLCSRARRMRFMRRLTWKPRTLRSAHPCPRAHRMRFMRRRHRTASMADSARSRPTCTSKPATSKHPAFLSTMGVGPRPTFQMTCLCTPPRPTQTTLPGTMSGRLQWRSKAPRP